MARIVFRQSRPPDRESSAAASWRARVEGQPAWKPINAVSHIAWGPRAAEQRQFTARYTGLGLLLNGVACVFWTWVYRARRRSEQEPVSLLRSTVRGIGISALAYATDYYLVPRRFTPGFELSLSRRSFPWLYGALAAGLILPEWLAGRKRRRSR